MTNLSLNDQRAVSNLIQVHKNTNGTLQSRVSQSTKDPESMAILAVEKMVSCMEETPTFLEVKVGKNKDPEIAWQEALGYCKACHKLGMDLLITDATGTEWINTLNENQWQNYTQNDGSLTADSIQRWYIPPGQDLPSGML